MSHPPPSRVLVVDDDRPVLDWLADVLASDQVDVRTAANAGAALRLLAEWQPHVLVTDLRLPDVGGLELVRRARQGDDAPEVLVLTGFGTIVDAVSAMQEGALTVLEKPVDADTLTAMVGQAIGLRRLRAERPWCVPASETKAGKSFIGTHPSVRALLDTVGRVAESGANCLVVGEHGTGKELIANALHQASHRASRPFITVNCAAIPAELIEAELFGHRKGAFTGASSDRAGFFEMASGGSLLLDEVGEMPPFLQAKLLRVLQEREYRPVGATRTVPVDVRLICSTNVDVDKAIAAGRLRPDLYFRINTVTLKTPALRQRYSDLPLLVDHFLAAFRTRYGKPLHSLSPDAMTRLKRHRWPGNVRELENAIERSVVVARGDRIEASDLPESLGVSGGRLEALPLPTTTLKAIERMAILEALEQANWNKRQAASALGLYRPTLYSRMRAHDIVDRRRRTAPTAGSLHRSTGPGRGGSAERVSVDS